MAFQRCHATFAGRAGGRFRLVKDHNDVGDGGRLSDRGKMCAEDQKSHRIITELEGEE